MNQVFLDTAYVLALELANDQNHRRVAEHWHRLDDAVPSLAITSLVFVEIVTFFNGEAITRKLLR